MRPLSLQRKNALSVYESAVETVEELVIGPCLKMLSDQFSLTCRMSLEDLLWMVSQGDKGGGKIDT